MLVFNLTLPRSEYIWRYLLQPDDFAMCVNLLKVLERVDSGLSFVGQGDSHAGPSLSEKNVMDCVISKRKYVLVY